MTEAKKKYAEYLKTPYWKEVSQLVKERAGHRCQMCNSMQRLQAHHRTYEHRGNEKEHLGDLICLCDACHLKFHTPTAAVLAPVRKKPTLRERQEINRTRKQKKRQAEKQKQLDRVPVMPVGDAVVLTKDLIRNCMTPRGGFTEATTTAFGTDLEKGWPKRIIGKVLTREKYAEAVAGRLVLKPHS